MRGGEGLGWGEGVAGEEMLALALFSGRQGYKTGQRKVWRFALGVWGPASEQGHREEVQLHGKDMCCVISSWGHELHAVAEQRLSLDVLI